MTVTKYRQYCVQCYLHRDEIAKLDAIVKMFGFRSKYQLLQCLLRMYLRYADTTAYEEDEAPLSREIEEMFDELMEEHGKERAYTTDRRATR